jgi:tetratricopeptide (TPR) repeat protein
MINSTDLEGLFNKANNFYDQQKYDEAIQYYDKILAIEPSNFNALYNKAIILQTLIPLNFFQQHLHPEFMVLEQVWNIAKNDLLVLQYYSSFTYFRNKISLNIPEQKDSIWI